MDNNIQITKELLAKYSFTFYAYDEKGEPLFTAPNGQIVGFNLVRNFIIEQENKLKQSQLVGSGGGIESMPNLPTVNQNIDQNTKERSDSNFENNLERASERPEKEENQENENDKNQNQNQTKIFTVTPKMAAAPKSVPFGDGFTPSKFDPSSLQDTKRFVQQNKKQGNSNSNKWLAVLFEKFVKEYEDQLNNNK